MIARLRGPYSPVELHRLYANRYDHTRWPDHIRRVEYTIGLGRRLALALPDVRLLADLSCGDGAIPVGIQRACPETAWHPKSPLLGDVTPGPHLDFVGPIERTLTRLPELVDLFICTETLEHVDDPARVLTGIRERARFLLLSTPETHGRDDNPEHYWSWDVPGVRELLEQAGWTPVTQSVLDLTYIPAAYAYQLWTCR